MKFSWNFFLTFEVMCGEGMGISIEHSEWFPLTDGHYHPRTYEQRWCFDTRLSVCPQGKGYLPWTWVPWTGGIYFGQGGYLPWTGGYLPWIGGGGVTYPGRGYLPWTGVYLPWMGGGGGGTYQSWMEGRRELMGYPLPGQFGQVMSRAVCLLRLPAGGLSCL